MRGADSSNINTAAFRKAKTSELGYQFDKVKASLTPEMISAGQKRSKELRGMIDARMKKGN